MLVITRKLGEKIMLGDDITIVVMRNKNGSKKGIVTIGIDAPQSVKILRGELYEAEKKDGPPASKGTEKED